MPRQFDQGKSHGSRLIPDYFQEVIFFVARVIHDHRLWVHVDVNVIYLLVNAMSTIGKGSIVHSARAALFTSSARMWTGNLSTH